VTRAPSQSAADAILVEGQTCRRLARADNAAVLIDGQAYYLALLEAFRSACCRIMIVGWDFDPRLRLVPDDEATELRRLLPALVAAHRRLHVHILVWDIAPLYGPSGTVESLLNRDWQHDDRIHFRFDGNHPSGASHHEKIVCVDDSLAFVGGIDLTTCRWDTPRHDAADLRRMSTSGEPYEPVHDLQMAVSGEAARAVAEVAHERWADASGETLSPCPSRGDIWPASAGTWLAGVPVGLARTRPRQAHTPGAAEIAALNDAALSAATRSLYIETQYLTASRIVDRLVELLERDDPPEVVIVIWAAALGWIERFAMGSNRERALRRLAHADHGGRLRVYNLTARGRPDQEVTLHAKLIVVDDRFVRVGSSNLNNRSLGLDTECDLAVEAVDAAGRSAIAALRETLLAEHLGCSSDDVRRAIEDDGLIGAIERLDAQKGLDPRPSRLRPHALDPTGGPTVPIPGTALLDPAEPIDLDHLARTLRHRLTSE